MDFAVNLNKNKIMYMDIAYGLLVSSALNFFFTIYIYIYVYKTMQYLHVNILNGEYLGKDII